MNTALAAPDLLIRKGMGRAHLNNHRLEEAVEIYAGVLRDYPEDVEAHLLLGDCYLAGGDAATAAHLYRRAHGLDPHNAIIGSRQALVHAEQGRSTSAPPEAVPTDPGAIARLLQRLTGRTAPVTEAEINRASSLLLEIVNSAEPARSVSERLNEIDSLLPALLELNIRQARADSRHDLAEALRLLLQNIHLQLDSQPARPATAAHAAQNPLQRVLFLAAGGEAHQRFALAAQALRALGCEAAVTDSAAPGAASAWDSLIAAPAGAESGLEDTLLEFLAAGRRVILDVGAHAAIPPADGSGPAVLRLANQICAPSEALAETLRAEGYNALAVPPGWSRDSGLLDSPPPRRSTINIGWLGGGVDDGIQIRRPIIRLLREFPQARLVVAGDPAVHRLFEDLPEAQRQFGPPISIEDAGAADWLAEVDILLVPLRPTLVNRLESDLPLVAAGARRIAWVASPIPAHCEWKEGGLLASSSEMWYSHLRRLIVAPDERRRLGKAGRKKAEEREMGRLGERWLQLVGQQARTASPARASAEWAAA